MRTKAFLSLAVVVVVGGALAGCGEEPIPDNVSYVKDIKPLMEARCIRCHGAGGTFNDDPESVKTMGLTKPNAGDFTGLGAGPAGSGLSSFSGPSAVLMKGYILPQKNPDTGAMDPPLMPPKPAPPLTDREREMLVRWVENPLP